MILKRSNFLTLGLITLLSFVLGSVAFGFEGVYASSNTATAGTICTGANEHGEVEKSADIHQEAHGVQNHGAHQKGAHHGPAPINWVDFGYKKNGKAPPLVAALFNFSVFVMLLFFHIPGTKIGLGLAGKLRDAYSDKHTTIKEGLEEGAKLRREAEAKLKEYGQKIKDVDSEVEGVLSEIKKDAEMERKRIVDEANHQAARAKAETKKRIESDLNMAKKGLEKTWLAAAALKAEEKIKNGQNAQDQNRLFEQVMGQLDQEIARQKNLSSDEALRRI